MPGWVVAAVLAIAAVVEALWIATLVVNRRAARVSAAPPIREPAAAWQAGRWDGDARHAYLANLGDEAAAEVIVTDDHRVLAVADSVPPYTADRLAPNASPPCYVSFLLDRRVRTTTLRVSWRAADDQWFAQAVRFD